MWVVSSIHKYCQLVISINYQLQLNYFAKLLSHSKEFDGDGDGYISAGELRQSLHKVGYKFAAAAKELTDDDVEEIMIELDLDSDGRTSTVNL